MLLETLEDDKEPLGHEGPQIHSGKPAVDRISYWLPSAMATEGTKGQQFLAYVFCSVSARELYKKPRRHGPLDGVATGAGGGGSRVAQALRAPGEGVPAHGAGGGSIAQNTEVRLRARKTLETKRSP